MSARSLAAAAFAAVAFAAVPAGPASAAALDLAATLNARSEVPRTDSRATGTAEFRVAADNKSIRYHLDATRLSGPPVAAHIHLGDPGEAGGILLTISGGQFTVPREGRLTKADFTATGDVRTFRQAIRAVRQGHTYVNIHTAKFPAGEIRGQVVRHH
jgi:hypothetical protein